MAQILKNFLFIYLLGFSTVVVSQNELKHPRLFSTNEERQTLLDKIESEAWAQESWNLLLEGIDPFVDRHVDDPEWIVSRLAMYWKKGERYTQCYIKDQDWDYGTGDAPVATVRLPGMRRWNDFLNVPLEDRIPYNETGDMLGVSRSKADKTPVLIPYKETGHMVRQNNMEILKLAEKSAFAYYITQEEKYAKFSSDIFWTWMLGVYYMNPPLDPNKSAGGPGGYEPGGILGYYDYEVIHDDRQIPMAICYDFLFDYLKKHSHQHLEALDAELENIAGTVFKRFIEIGLVRGGKTGNWNVNRYKNILKSMLVLESNEFYEDGKGREYYIPFYTEKSGDHYAGLPEILGNYNKITGLWPESPGYASGMIPYVLDMGLQLYKADVNILQGNPIITKAALANLGWLDARGNLVVFGDMRGGPANMSAFESLLTYATWEGDDQLAEQMATVIRKNTNSGQYDRSQSDWKGIVLNQPLPPSGNSLPFHRTAYSPFHRHLIMKNGNDEKNGLMFTMYGGKEKSHLAKNGLAMQFYREGWAIAPDASAYESYWTKDAAYHRKIAGSNTIVPGYEKGPITINAMDPSVDKSKGFYNTSVTSKLISFADVSAEEKRRVVAMIRTSETTGYYVDVFRSDQLDNDYIHHNLGERLILKSTSDKEIKIDNVDDLGVEYNKAYSFFTNQKKVSYSKNFLASWFIERDSLVTDMWMLGQSNRELYVVDAPPTTLRKDLTPGEVNRSPESTPTLIVRQRNNNGAKHPFVAVFETYKTNKKSLDQVSKLKTSNNFVSISVASKNSTQYVFSTVDNECYKPMKNTRFQGVFGVVSESQNNFQYLYLGKGKLLEFEDYKIEAVEDEVTAELKEEAGKIYYSADNAIFITLKGGVKKQYNSGYNIEIK